MTTKPVMELTRVAQRGTSLYAPPLLRPEERQVSSADAEAIETFRNYLASRRLAATTIKLRTVYVRKCAEWQSARGRGLFDVRPSDIEDFAYSNPDWSPATIVTVVASMRAFYAWAARRDFTVENLARDLLSVRVHRTPSRIASDEAIRQGLARATVAEQAMILLGAECGLRVSEIAALDRGSREGDMITIRGKGGVFRNLFLTPELSTLLDLLENTDMRWGFYFPGKSGGHAHPSMVWRHIRDLVDVNPHALRHRAGTTVYRETGFDIRVTQEFLGHSSPTTTAIYVHVEREDLRKAAQAARVGSL
jgi:integrase/recombinase XerC